MIACAIFTLIYIIIGSMSLTLLLLLVVDKDKDYLSKLLGGTLYSFVFILNISFLVISLFKFNEADIFTTIPITKEVFITDKYIRNDNYIIEYIDANQKSISIIDKDQYTDIIINEKNEIKIEN